MSQDRLEWWTAAFRSVICAKENKCKKLQSYFDLPEWWIYDVFILADDFDLVVPAVCQKWRLAEFMYALMTWHKKQTTQPLIVVEQQEKSLIGRAYSGRRCWYESEKRFWRHCFAPRKIFENIQPFNLGPCRFCA